MAVFHAQIDLRKHKPNGKRQTKTITFASLICRGICSDSPYSSPFVGFYKASPSSRIANPLSVRQQLFHHSSRVSFNAKRPYTFCEVKAKKFLYLLALEGISQPFPALFACHLLPASPSCCFARERKAIGQLAKCLWTAFGCPKQHSFAKCIYFFAPSFHRNCFWVVEGNF